MLQAITRLHHRFDLGAFSITQLSDGTIEHSPSQGFFGVNADAATFESVSRAHGLSTDRFAFPATITLIERGVHRILVDAGHGPSRKPSAGHLAGALAQAGIAPESITQVLISHLHRDHTGGLLDEVGEPVFTNAHHRLNPKEASYWTDAAAQTDIGRAAHATLDALRDLVGDVRPGQMLIPGVQVIASDGHTPGHVSVLVESDRQKLLVAGDVANHPVWSIQRPDWHMSLDVDPDQAARTRHRLLGMVAVEDMLMAGYHMPFPAIGRIRHKGAGFAYVPLD